LKSSKKDNVFENHDTADEISHYAELY